MLRIELSFMGIRLLYLNNDYKGERNMKRRRLTLTELIKENKEEILRDSTQLKKIEKRLDDKMVKSK